MERGWRNRSTGATLMNADSSRSHSIFCISVEMLPLTKEFEASPIRRGKLNLVDLAGSERQTKTGYQSIHNPAHFHMKMHKRILAN